MRQQSGNQSQRHSKVRNSDMLWYSNDGFCLCDRSMHCREEYHLLPSDHFLRVLWCHKWDIVWRYGISVQIRLSLEYKIKWNYTCTDFKCMDKLVPVLSRL